MVSVGSVSLGVKLDLGDITSDIKRLNSNITRDLKDIKLGIDLGGVTSKLPSATKSVNVYRDALGRLRDEKGRFVAETNKASSSLSGFGGILKSINSQFDDLNLKDIGSLVATGVGELGTFAVGELVEASKAAGTFKRNLAGVEALIESTGGTAGVTAEQIDDFARRMGRATLSNRDEILEGSRALLSFKSIAGETFFRAQETALDLSETLKTSFRGSLIQVAKALEDPIRGLTALRRSGVSFTADQEKLIKSLEKSGNRLQAQNEILKVLEGQFKGTAAAAAQGLLGQIDTFNEELNDIRINLGTAIEPALAGSVNVFNQALAEVGEETGVFEELEESAKELEQALINNPKLVGLLADALSNLLNVGIQSLDFLVNRTTELAQGFEGLPAPVRETLDQAKLLLSEIGTTVGIVGSEFGPSISSIAGDLVRLTGLVLEGFRAIQQAVQQIAPAISGVADILADAINKTIDLIDNLRTAAALASGSLGQQTDELNANAEVVDDVLVETIQLLGKLKRAKEENGEIDKELIRITEAQIKANKEEVASLEKLIKEGAANGNNIQAQIGALEALTAQAERRIATDEEVADSQEVVATAVQKATTSIEEQEKAIKKAVGAAQNLSAIAQREIGASEAQQITAVQQAVLDEKKTEEQAAAEIEAIEQASTEKIIAIKEQELAKIQKLAQGKTEAAQAAAKIESQLTEEIANLNLRTIEQELAARKKLAAEQKRLAVEAANAQFSAARQPVQGQRDSLSFRQGILNQELSLLQAQANLQRSISDLERERLETQIAEAEVSGDKVGADQLRLQLVEQQTQAIEEQQKFELEQLRLKQELLTLSAQQKALDAELAVLDREQALALARINKEEALQIKQKEQALKLAKKQLDFANRQIEASKEVLAEEEKALRIKQKSTLENQKQARIRAQAAANDDGLGPLPGQDSTGGSRGGSLSSRGGFRGIRVDTGVGEVRNALDGFFQSVNSSLAEVTRINIDDHVNSASKLLENLAQRSNSFFNIQPDLGQIPELSARINGRTSIPKLQAGGVATKEDMNRLIKAISENPNNPTLIAQSPNPIADLGKMQHQMAKNQARALGL